jgi:hypothetical protein
MTTRRPAYTLAVACATLFGVALALQLARPVLAQSIRQVVRPWRCLARFMDHTTIPPVGSHVAITGTFVTEKNHAQWNEIHPVSSIAVQ